MYSNYLFGTLSPIPTFKSVAQRFRVCLRLSPSVDRSPQDMLQRGAMAAYCKVLLGVPALGKDASVLRGLIATGKNVSLYPAFYTLLFFQPIRF